MDAMIGRVIGGRFRVLKLLGEGGMGAVYLAQHEALPRKLAIKILRPQLAKDKSFIERFRREAIAASRIEHPNVIYITDFGHTEDGSVYLAMEYLEGIGLDRVLAKQVRIPPSRTLPILAQIADALDLAHQMSVVHRDLKPENIQLTLLHGRKDFVKLLDFGIAKLQTPEFDGAALTIRGQVFGTAEYMSPEQASGRPVDGRSDIYSLGCLAYEMLTGDPPFLGPAVQVLRAHVQTPPPPPSTKMKGLRLPPSLDALVLRCLSKNPKERYQTGAELRQDLLRTRALLFSMADPSEQEAGRARITGRLHLASTSTMSEGWQALGGKAPETLLPFAANPILFDRPVTGMIYVPPPSSPDKIREEIYDILRELSMSLVQAALAPAEISEALERLLVVEEEVATLTGTIALAEQNFDRIRFEFGQKEKRLRFAILDLSMEQAQLKGRSIRGPEEAAEVAGQLADLEFQIGELHKRCREIEDDRKAHIHELDAEVKQHRERRLALEQEASVIFQTLHSLVEVLRPKAGESELRTHYEKLDALRLKLDEARQG
jgi:serine/threonine protein kinase